MTVEPVTGRSYALSDRYTRDDGTVFMSGLQALARIPLQQLRADRRDGRHTGAFASGYPGSPLAGYDREVSAATRAANVSSTTAMVRSGELKSATPVRSPVADGPVAIVTPVEK